MKETELINYLIKYREKENTEEIFLIFKNKYQNLIYKTIWEIQNNDILYDIEDMFQEGLIILDNCMKKYNIYNETKFITYFTTSLKNKYIKLYNKSKNKKNYELKEEIFENKKIQQDNILEKIELNNICIKLKKLLQYKLTEKEIDIFYNVVLNEHRYKNNRYLYRNGNEIDLTWYKYNKLKKEVMNKIENMDEFIQLKSTFLSVAT